MKTKQCKHPEQYGDVQSTCSLCRATWIQLMETLTDDLMKEVGFTQTPYKKSVKRFKDILKTIRKNGAQLRTTKVEIPSLLLFGFFNNTFLPCTKLDKSHIQTMTGLLDAISNFLEGIFIQGIGLTEMQDQEEDNVA